MSDTDPQFQPPEATPHLNKGADDGLGLQGTAQQGPVGAPAPNLLPPTQPAVKKRRYWIIAVVLGAALLIGAGVYGAITLANSFAKTITSALQFPRASQADQEPVHIDGTPGPTVARDPLDCPSACFTSASVENLIPPKGEFELLGVPKVTTRYGYYDTITVQESRDTTAQYWSEGNGSPADCEFVLSPDPVAEASGVPDPEGSDKLYYLGDYQGDGNNFVSQSLRLFDDSAAAESYMSNTSILIEGCSKYSFKFDSGIYNGNVEAIADLGTPASVAAIGWVESEPTGEWTYSYVVDLQRGNVVVRSVLSSDYSISETDFRRFLNHYAAQMAAVEPK